MQSCQTTLVLITSRIGSFDDAFTSRQYVSPYYPEFKEEKREKLWQIFFHKMGKERKDIMRVSIEAWITRKRRKSKRWVGTGGRQRMAKDILSQCAEKKHIGLHLPIFPTAVALGDLDREKAEEGKIYSRRYVSCKLCVCLRSQETHLKELHRGDENKRVDRERMRYKKFDH